MTVTIDSRNPCSVAALGLMPRAGSWPRCHLKDGQKFYAVPSRFGPLTDVRDDYLAQLGVHRQT